MISHPVQQYVGPPSEVSLVTPDGASALTEGGESDTTPPSPHAQSRGLSNVTARYVNSEVVPSAEMAFPRAQTYFDCPLNDLTSMVANVLEEIVSINDAIPFNSDKLTRFHSRSPPSISIRDYLFRVVKFCGMDKAILVVLLYFIDLLTQSYPNFVVTTLTVHRFIITSVTVASKGLCDSFCTNAHYAKVGGVSQVELNLLEVEFLTRVGYRIVPDVKILQEYYDSMAQRQNTKDAEQPLIGHQKKNLVADTSADNQMPTSENVDHQDLSASFEGSGSKDGTPVNHESSGSDARNRGFRGTMKSMRKFLHPQKKKRQNDDNPDPLALSPKRPKA